MLSGMLGVGVAFLAIPILSFADDNLVGSVQPLALLLNGTTAMFAAIAFGIGGHIDWRRASMLAAALTVAAPLGVALAHRAPTALLWLLFYIAVGGVIWSMLRKPEARAVLDFRTVCWLGIPVGCLCSMLGLGPGFIVVALMALAGLPLRSAAAITSAAVVPCSFIAFGVHMTGQASLSPRVPLLVALAASGALLGGYLSGRVIAERPLRAAFIVAIVSLGGYKGVLLVRPALPIAKVAVYIDAMPFIRAA